MIPHRGVVVEIRCGSARVIDMNDPHLFPKDRLYGDVDRDHGKKTRAEVQEHAAVAPVTLLVLQYHRHADAIEDKLYALRSTMRVEMT